MGSRLFISFSFFIVIIPNESSIKRFHVGTVSTTQKKKKKNIDTNQIQNFERTKFIKGFSLLDAKKQIDILIEFPCLKSD